MRERWRRFWAQLNCNHSWQVAHYTYLPTEGFLVSYYCTECGAVKWAME